MGNSRKSPSPNKAATTVAARFERALEAIPARVVVSGGAIALAYSGGLDSALLLRLLADLGRRNGRQLFAFHVHHGLSPNADDWLAHCAREAATLGVRFEAMRVALPDANPSVYLTLSLGVTFPFNLVIGIPAWVAVAQAVGG